MVARGSPSTSLGRQAVAELGVDVVGADDALGQLGPGVGVLVGEPGAAEDGRPSSAPPRSRPRWMASAAGAQGRRPRGTSTQPVARRAPAGVPRRSALLTRLEVEAALVAQPAPVDGVDVDAVVAQQLVALTTARRCGSRPSTSCRSTRPGSRSHGRALKRYGLAVSAPTGQICTVLPLKYDENGSSGNVLTSVWLPRLDEVDQRVAGHLVGEAGAAVAQDAALPVEQHQVADAGSASRSGASPRRSGSRPGRRPASGPAAGTRRPCRTPGSRAGG